MIELGRVMHDAADAALDGRPVVGPAGVVTRVRRRRAVRAAGTGAVGMAAVGAVAVAGIQSEWWRDAGPVATPTTAGPTVDDGGWPVVRLAPDARFECGQPVPQIVDPAGDADLHLEVKLARESAFDPENPSADTQPAPESFLPIVGATLTQGDYWSLDVAMVNDSDQSISAGEATPFGLRPSAFIAQDGVIVGTVAEEVQLAIGYVPVPITFTPGEVHTDASAVRFTSCAGTGSVVNPLSEGAYDVYITRSLLTVPRPSGIDGYAPEADPLATLVGGPYPVTIQGGVVPSSIGQLNEYLCEHEPPGAEDVQLSFEGLVGGCHNDTVLPIGWEIPDEVPSTSLLTWDPAYCADSPTPGRWVEVWTAGSGRSPYLEVDVVGDRVARIDTFMDTTPLGIMNGSTLAQVQRAYPAVELMSSATDTGYGVDAWAVSEGGGTLVFEIAVDPSTAGIYGVGRVVAMSVLAPGTTYDHPATGSAMCR